MTKPLSLKKDRSTNVFVFFIQLPFILVLHLFGRSTFCCGAQASVLQTGRMRAPATQQLSIRPPRIRRLPLQPYVPSRYWLRGARKQRNTGLPAIASPLAKGRLARKYLLMMVRDAFRLKASPQPACRKIENISVTFQKPSGRKTLLNLSSKGYLIKLRLNLPAAH